MSEIDYNEDTWEVIKLYLQQYQGKELIRHHLDTFNDFMDNKIGMIVKQFNPLVVYHEYIQKSNSYKYEIHIEYGDVHYNSPLIHENDGSSKPMFPHEARLRNLTYSVPIYINLDIKIITHGDNGKQVVIKNLKNVKIGKIPIMVRSKYCLLSKVNVNTDIEECKYDLGGYFIINGNEKVIVSQEKIAENKVYVFKSSKTSSKYSHVAEVKSIAENTYITPKNVAIKLLAKEGTYGRTLKVFAPHVRLEIPLFVMFRALGVETDKEIIKTIIYDIGQSKNKDILSWLKPSVEEASNILTQEQAIEYLLKGISILGQPKDIKLDKEKKTAYLINMIRKEFLPHMGNDFKFKSYYLGYMVQKLFKCYFKEIPYDDRDSYCNKRIETPGVLMASLFRQYFTKLVKDMRNSIMKELNSGPWKSTKNIEDIVNATNLYKIFKSTTIESGLKYGLATGNWGVKSTTSKVGIAQVLSRLSYSSTLSHLRRVNTPTEKTGKLVPPRKLHNTQWGIICPTETPEGGSVGLVKNLALTTHITNYKSSYPVMEYLNSNGLILLSDLKTEELFDKTKVFVNGKWIGIHNNPIDLYKIFKNLKRLCKINPYTSIAFNYTLNEITIFTDGGRCCRPLYIVKDNTLMIKKSDIEKIRNKKYVWNNLILNYLNDSSIYSKNDSKKEVKEGLIEYLDSDEMQNTLIAMTPKNLKNLDIKYTHCEIHPSLILGVVASTIPFSHHNQSPRNTYQSAMGKQAMGIYATNYLKRLDTMAHILYYFNKPMVNTRTSNFLATNDIPSGQNVIVAIASYSGYNQEDSIIMNKSAVQRGLFRSTFYRTYKDDEKKIQSSGHEERFVKPDKSFTRSLKPGSYDKLKNNGFVEVNTHVEANDIIIGKVIPIKNTTINGNQVYRDNSTSLRNNESGFIDKISVNRNGEGHRFCKVRVRSPRVPTIGDKFSSRHGQKGTMGMILDQEDMPFTKDGLIPDIIINPHAIPSRMTIAQLLECLMGKVGTNLGAFGDGTPFINNDSEKATVHRLGEILEEECGYSKYGDEILYEGHTGKQLSTKIFIGPTFYQRLKHMVEDKIHSRSSGPMVLLTRQPAEGRARDGGLRFGEMERDCMIAHGTLQFLKERMLDVSDNYRLFICNLCGLTAQVNPEKNIYKCTSCSNFTDFSEVRLPYSCKLLIQELESMSIAPRLLIK